MCCCALCTWWRARPELREEDWKERRRRSGRSESDLPGLDGGTGRVGTAEQCSRRGGERSTEATGEAVEGELGASDAVLRVPRRMCAKVICHGQRGGVLQQGEPAEGDQDARPASQRGGGDEAVATWRCATWAPEMGHGAAWARQALNHFPGAVGRPHPGGAEPVTNEQNARSSGADSRPSVRAVVAACAAARNLDAPFPVSPSGGKPGRAGSPRRRHAARPAKALARIVRRLPPTEGCRPLADPPAKSARARTRGLATCGTTARSRDYTRRPPSADVCRGVYTKYPTYPA